MQPAELDKVWIDDPFSLVLSRPLGKKPLPAVHLRHRAGVAFHFLRFDGIFYPCSPAYILLVGGLVMSVTAGVMAWERRRPLSADGVMVNLGRASLTLLLLHVWMFRELSRSVGLWSAFDAPAAFGVTMLAIGIYTLLAWQWRKVGFRFGAEWLLRKVAG